MGRGAAAGLDPLDALTYRSNLLGADRAVAKLGGGNTSAKGTVVDHAGRETRVLWVKGSGTDLATITPAGFAALRLDDLLPLRERTQMDDATMVDHLLRTALGPGQPRPSIETTLHAFVRPRRSTTPTRRGDRADLVAGRGALADEAFGDEAVWLHYQRPGFGMSRRIAELLEEQPGGARVLLEKHGLVTWGETGEESYGGDHRVGHPGGARPSTAPVRTVRTRRPEGRGDRRRRGRAAARRRAPRSGRAPREAAASSSRSTAARRRSRSPPRRGAPR